MRELMTAAAIAILMFVTVGSYSAYADVEVTVSWDAPAERVDGTPYDPQPGATYELYETVAGVRGPVDVVPYTQLTQVYIRSDGYQGVFELRTVDSTGLASVLSEPQDASILPPPWSLGSRPGKSGIRIIIRQL